MNKTIKAYKEALKEKNEIGISYTYYETKTALQEFQELIDYCFEHKVLGELQKKSQEIKEVLEKKE